MNLIKKHKNKKEINWNTIDQQIKNLKYPIVFILNIVKKQHKIEDYQLSLIIRYFLKNKLEIVLNYPIFLISKLLNSKFVITKKVLNDFYFFTVKKIVLVNILIKFKESYIVNKPFFESDNKEDFWSKSTIEQKKELEEVYNIMKANFDSSISGSSGLSRYLNSLKCGNNNFMIRHLTDRISNIVLLFGVEFFEKNKILLIKKSDFDNLEIENKIKFVLYFSLKLDKLLRSIINSYEILIIYDIKLKQIINPKPIYINLKTIVYSNDNDDNDSEDYLDLLIES